MTSGELVAMGREWGNRKSLVARVVAPKLMDAAKKQQAVESGFPAGMVAAQIEDAIRCAEVAETFADPEFRDGVRPTLIWNKRTQTFEVNYW
jgi:hypothetical protein